MMMNKKISLAKEVTIMLLAVFFTGMVLWQVGQNYVDYQQQKNFYSYSQLPIITNLEETQSHEPETKNDNIRVGFPLANDKIGGTINVTGIAKGIWYFEGDFPVSLVDMDGKILDKVPAVAQGEWMREDFVPFLATLKYQVSESQKALLVLEKDNPSDMRELDEKIEIPVTLEPKTETANLYFASYHLDPNSSVCERVFPSARTFPQTMAMAHMALESLFSGTTEKEDVLGYYTAIPKGVKINWLDFSGKVARVDLSKEILNLYVAGPCRQTIIKKQIEETLKQFGGIEEVKITVEGDPYVIDKH